MKRNWKKIALIIMVVIVGIFVYRNFQDKSSAKKLTTYTVKRQDLSESLTLSGYIDAHERTTLRFQTAGQIAWIGVKEGDKVNKYQTIASLDQSILKKQLQKTLSTYIKYRDTFDQTKDNYKDKVITDDIKRIADQTQQDLNNSVADVELQNLTIKYANLWTPIEGIVTKVNSPVEGVNISTPTQAEFEIVNPKTIYFTAVVDQTDVANIQPGMRGEFTLDAFPNEKITGVVNKIGFTPKEGESGTVYSVDIELDNKDLDYKFGMTGDISFKIKEKKNVIALPKNLVKGPDNQKYVSLRRSGQIIKQFVTTGEIIDNQVEIVSGLNSSDVVVNQP